MKKQGVTAAWSTAEGAKHHNSRAVYEYVEEDRHLFQNDEMRDGSLKG